MFWVRMSCGFVILPIYNEELLIRSSIATLDAYLRKLTADDFELIAVDNGSTDSTRLVCESLGQDFPAFRYLYLPARGPGRAFVAGVQAASG